jgi:hypothetical protein
LELLTTELEHYQPVRRLRVLAILEQQARQESDLSTMRAVRQYRDKMAVA